MNLPVFLSLGLSAEFESLQAGGGSLLFELFYWASIIDARAELSLPLHASLLNTCWVSERCINTSVMSDLCFILPPAGLTSWGGPGQISDPVDPHCMLDSSLMNSQLAASSGVYQDKSLSSFIHNFDAKNSPVNLSYFYSCVSFSFLKIFFFNWRRPLVDSLTQEVFSVYLWVCLIRFVFRRNHELRAERRPGKQDEKSSSCWCCAMFSLCVWVGCCGFSLDEWKLLTHPGNNLPPLPLSSV